MLPAWQCGSVRKRSGPPPEGPQSPKNRCRWFATQMLSWDRFLDRHALLHPDLYLCDYIPTQALCVIAPFPTRVSVHTDGRAADAELAELGQTIDQLLSRPFLSGRSNAAKD